MAAHASKCDLSPENAWLECPEYIIDGQYELERICQWKVIQRSYKSFRDHDGRGYLGTL